MGLSYASTTSLNIAIQTETGGDWEVDWGDGVWIRYVSSASLITKTFGSPTSGVARFRAVNNTIDNINYVHSTVGTWNFDISSLSNVTYYVFFNGSSMTLTGDISALSNVTYLVYFSGNSMTLTYTTTTWVTIPSNSVLLSLATGYLATSAEVDNLLIDLNATGASGTGTIDLRYNNAAPTATSAEAITALQSRGWTVLTN